MAIIESVCPLPKASPLHLKADNLVGVCMDLTAGLAVYRAFADIRLYLFTKGDNWVKFPRFDYSGDRLLLLRTTRARTTASPLIVCSLALTSLDASQP